jgi:hypothetical protein
MLYIPTLRTIPLSSLVPGAISLLAATACAQSLVRTALEFSPPPLVGAQLAYDLIRARGVMFGGLYDDPAPNPTSYGIPSDDTHEWTGSEWIQVSTTVRPPARSYHSLAFDGSRTILFGGTAITATTLQDLGDTWAFDGVGWSQLTPTASPSPRGGHSVAFDQLRGRIVLFGGADATQQFAETWEWDGVTWALAAPATSPPARSQAQIVYDPIRSRVVLFGGVAATGGAPQLLQDTWEYDGVTWTQVATATVPPARILGALDYDLLGSQVVLFGGSDANSAYMSDAWTYDGTDWTAMTVANAITLADCAHTFDLIQQRIVYFGGATDTFSVPSSFWGTIDLTHLLVRGPATAAYTVFGAGCIGQGGFVPTLDAAPGSLPVTGTTFAATIDFQPLAAPYALVLMGFSNTSWAGGALPFDLSTIGIGGGCNLLVDPLGTAVIGNGVEPAVFRLDIPLNPMLSGLVFFNQALVLDPLAPNGLGAMTSGYAATVQ